MTIEVIEKLIGSTITDKELMFLKNYDGQAEYEYTGCGYFLSIKTDWLPDIEETFSEPAVVGNFGRIQSGFVVFFGNKELTIECHTWGEIEVPSNYREMPVVISTPKINTIILNDKET